MRKFLAIAIGLCAFGALWEAEDEADGPVVARAPFLAALAIEAGIFLRRHQTGLLASRNARGD